MVGSCVVKILFFLVTVASAQEYGGQLDDPDKVMVGDMILTRRQHRWLYSNDTIKRHGLSNKAFRWPGGRVPVVISPQFPRSFQDTIKAAGAYITQATCARFDFNVDPRSEPNHLNVVPAGSGICNALVGYNRQPSTVRLDPNMCSKGNVIHEFLHVLGFYHMHTAADRDNFIDINFNNIKDGYKGQFDKIVKEVSMFNTQYEYGSIMHYAPDSFAKNAAIPVIRPKSGRQAPDMGQRDRLSAGDIQRVNRMYECQ